MGWSGLGACGTLALMGLAACSGAGEQTGSNASKDQHMFVYDTPADWNAHTVSGSRESGIEPVNFILTGDSDVGIDELISAMGADHWQKVSIGTGVFDPASGKCISEETATVEPNRTNANAGQSISLRVDGCNGIWESGENHARLYPQGATGAWFVAAAKEHPCLIAAIPPWWHCIDSDGYNLGRDGFFGAVMDAASRQGWYIACEDQPRPAGTGLDGIKFDDYLFACVLSHWPIDTGSSGAPNAGWGPH